MHVGWRIRRHDASFTARAIHNAWTYLNEVRAFRSALLKGRGGRFLQSRLHRAHRFGPVLSDPDNGEICKTYST